MAVVYLRSTTGNDANDGSTWNLAKATLSAAITAAGVNGTVYVSQAHNETITSTTLSVGILNISSSNMLKILCVSDAAEPPTALATGAKVSNTFNGIAFFYGCNGGNPNGGAIYVYGITFQGGKGDTTNCGHHYFGAGSTSTTRLVFESCDFINTSTTNSSAGMFAFNGGLNSAVILRNCSMTFGHALHYASLNSCTDFRWLDSSNPVRGIMPDSLFNVGVSYRYDALLSGLDLSALTGKIIFQYGNGNAISGSLRLVNCKLPASVTIKPANGNSILPNFYLSVENADSADTNYRLERYDVTGTLKSEVSKIRLGGASDGVTALSWSMASSASTHLFMPMESTPITFWSDTTGSPITLSLQVAQNSGATALNNDEIWLEVSYVGTAGFPIGATASGRKVPVAVAAAHPASTATWNNMTNPTRQTLSVTFTPQKKGPIQVKVMLAKASTTVYVDPLVIVT